MKTVFDLPQTAARPRYISHRGFQPLAPANSLPGFRYAGFLGQWAIETDVRFTRDGEAVCSHDAAVDAAFDGTGTIADMTWKELSALRMNTGSRLECLTDGDRRIPLFSEYLAICRKYHSIPFIELKTDDAERVIRLVREAGLEDGEAVMSSSNLDRLTETRKYSKDMFVHWIFGNEENIDRLAGLGFAGMSWNDSDWAHFPQEKIDLCHRRGLRVCLRAGDSRVAVGHMLAMGLDYIPSNCMHGELEEREER